MDTWEIRGKHKRICESLGPIHEYQETEDKMSYLEMAMASLCPGCSLYPDALGQGHSPLLREMTQSKASWEC